MSAEHMRSQFNREANDAILLELAAILRRFARELARIATDLEQSVQDPRTMPAAHTEYDPQP